MFKVYETEIASYPIIKKIKTYSTEVSRDVGMITSDSGSIYRGEILLSHKHLSFDWLNYEYVTCKNKGREFSHVEIFTNYIMTLCLGNHSNLELSKKSNEWI